MRFGLLGGMLRGLDTVILGIGLAMAPYVGTAEALAWDESFRNLDDPSGRAVQGVHRTARDE